MFPEGLDRKFWLFGIAAGLATGPLIIAMAAAIPTAWSNSLIFFYFAGPSLFAAVLIFCLRSTIGINWWRGVCLLLGILAAQYGAFRLAVHLGERIEADIYTVPLAISAFAYAAVFAMLVTAVAALLFPVARDAKLIAATILASGVVALSYVPLEEMFPNWFVSPEAALITFGLVYAAAAAFLGTRLFVRRPVATE